MDRVGAHCHSTKWSKGSGLLWDQKYGLPAPKSYRDLKLRHGAYGALLKVLLSRAGNCRIWVLPTPCNPFIVRSECSTHAPYQSYVAALMTDLSKLTMQDNHIYTSGATGTNAAVIRGALRAEKPDLLTVVLPQSRSKQPPESQELLSEVCLCTTLHLEGDDSLEQTAMLFHMVLRGCPPCALYTGQIASHTSIAKGFCIRPCWPRSEASHIVVDFMCRCKMSLICQQMINCLCLRPAGGLYRILPLPAI